MNARAGLFLAVAALSGVVLHAATEIRVTPLVDNGRVFASFVAAGALTEDAQDIVRSGLVLTLS
jgi:hypothetical protein